MSSLSAYLDYGIRIHALMPYYVQRIGMRYTLKHFNGFSSHGKQKTLQMLCANKKKVFYMFHLAMSEAESLDSYAT